MGSFVLSCESTADYPRSFFEARGIEYIMFHYELDGVVHEDDLYQSVTPEAFFGALKAGSTSKTSQVSVGEYTEFWKPMLEAGKDVLHPGQRSTRRLRGPRNISLTSTIGSSSLTSIA